MKSRSARCEQQWGQNDVVLGYEQLGALIKSDQAVDSEGQKIDVPKSKNARMNSYFASNQLPGARR